MAASSPHRRDDGSTGTHVLVVGGGIAGLAAAARVLEQRPDAEVTLLEASDRVGGKLRLAEVAGVRIDVGAEAMLHRRPEAVTLARRVGLGEDVVHPATTKANLWTRDRLTPMPRTLMGVPTDLRALGESGVLSRAGLARAALDSLLPATDLTGRDVSVGDLVEERLGREVVDRLVEPLLGGVYAGHAREISARAAVPQVVALLDRDRALSRAAAATLDRTDTVPDQPPAPVFAGLRGGVGRLPGAVVEALSGSGLRVELDATVRDVARRPGGGWTLVVGDTRAPRLVHGDALVLATPAAATARLLSDVAPDAALELARVEYASMAIVTLAVPADAAAGLPGSGFLVPPVDGHVVKAATFSHRKWDWVREAGARPGTEAVALLRCSIGRHREEQVLQVSDEELVALARRDLAAAVGLDATPVETLVRRWGGALPQYAVGHLDRVALIRAAVARVPGLAVCGAAYDGLGIPACIASAHRAVEELFSTPHPAPEGA